jgi:L-lactate dehydrogenase
VKVGVVGVGAVGAATALSLIERGGMCRELVLVDRTTERANGVATDLRYATPLSPTVEVRAGDYDALADAALVIITAGVNEQAGGATDRSDPKGRLRLLDTNLRPPSSQRPGSSPGTRVGRRIVLRGWLVRPGRCRG